MKKNKVIGLLATLGCIAVGAGVTTLAPVTAKAETSEVLASISANFNMEYGASVRIGTENGIRFTATLDKTVYTNLEGLEADTTVKVNYGMLIIPKDKTTEVANPELVFGDGYALEDCDTESEVCNCGKTHIAAVKYEALNGAELEHETKEDVMYLRGSLVGIQESNLTREFVGIGYIEYMVGSEATYYLAAYAKDKGDEESSPNIENNTRSMTYVAQLAIADNKDTEEGTLQASYVTPLAGNQYKYTIKHYLPKDVKFRSDNVTIYWEGMWEDKSNYWEEATTEECYGTLGTALTLDMNDVGVSSDLDCADYVKLVRYRGSANQTLFANGKTVLESYWRVEPNATEDTKYDITNKIATTTETVLDSDLEKNVLKLTDPNAANALNSQGVKMGLKYCEALVIFQLIQDETTNFTFNFHVKATSSSPHASRNPLLTVIGAKSQDATHSSSLSEGFDYNAWNTIAYAETDNNGSNFTTINSAINHKNGPAAGVNDLARYFIGTLSFFYFQNCFSAKKDAGTYYMTVYIDEISFSVSSAE